MKRTESMEMYLETILKLSKNNNKARIAKIAAELKVSKPSVNKAINILKENNYIKHEPYGPVILTEKGRKLAEEIYSKHLLITAYFIEILNLDPNIAEENACRIEHVISDEVLEAMKEKVNYTK